MESLQTGRVVRELKAQLGRLPDWLSYYAAVLRTSEGAVMPTEGEILNVVKRVPLGVVAQVRLPLVQSQCHRPQLISLFNVDRTVQSPSADRRQEDRTSSRTSVPSDSTGSCADPGLAVRYVVCRLPETASSSSLLSTS